MKVVLQVVDSNNDQQYHLNKVQFTLFCTINFMKTSLESMNAPSTAPDINAAIPAFLTLSSSGLARP